MDGNYTPHSGELLPSQSHLAEDLNNIHISTASSVNSVSFSGRNVTLARPDTEPHSHGDHIARLDTNHRLRSYNDYDQMKNMRAANPMDHVHEVKVEVDEESTYPHEAWDRLKLTVPMLNSVKPVDPTSQISPKCIRFVCISDTHGRVEKKNFHENIPIGDVLLHAGDFTMHGEVEEIKAFNQFLGRLPHQLKFVISGNHELLFDPRGYYLGDKRIWKDLGLPINTAHKDVSAAQLECVKALITNAIYLQDTLAEFSGLKIYGVPWLPVYGRDGFGLRRGCKLLRMYDLIPSGVDVLLSHGPPLGFGDFTVKRKHVGCVELFKSIRERIKPKYLVCGHIHEGYGVYTDGTTTYINAATCNKVYRPANSPIVFDLALPKPFTKKQFAHLTPEDVALTWFKPKD